MTDRLQQKEDLKNGRQGVELSIPETLKCCNLVFLRTSLAALSFLLFATVTFAQSTTVRVVRSAFVVAEPSGRVSET